MIEFNPDAPKCPLCAVPIVGYVTRPNVQPSSLPFGIVSCGNCGGILARDRTTGVERTLTRAEKLLLPTHPRAAHIRDHQERVIAKLWG